MRWEKREKKEKMKEEEKENYKKLISLLGNTKERY